MPLTQRIFFATLAGWGSRVVLLVLQLFFIRILFQRMTEEEQGFWQLLGNSAVFIALMDLGLAFTLTRRIALARGKSGADPNATLTEISRIEIADLVATGARAYRVISLVVFLVSWGIGLAFLSQLKYEQISQQDVWIAWTILCAGYSINVWAQVWPCLLNGIGLVGLNTIVDTGIGVLAFAVQIGMVLSGQGIIALAIVGACRGLVSRQISLIVARRHHPELFKTPGTWSSPQLRSMLSPAIRAWLTHLGAFLILKTDQYFISYFMGASYISEYNAAYQVVLIISTFSVAISLGSEVYVSHLWQAGDIQQIHVIVKRNMRMGMILLVCGLACLMVAGKPLIELWLGPGHFVGYPVLFAFCLLLALETHHSLVAICSRATEDEAFAVPAMLSGALNLIFTYLLIHRYGLLGVVLGTVTAQLLTNNWYCVYRGLRRLRMSIWDHIQGVLLPTAGVFFAALGLGYAAVSLTAGVQSNLLTVVSAAGATGLVLVASLWFRGLTPAQRTRIVGRVTAGSAVSVR